MRLDAEAVVYADETQVRQLLYNLVLNAKDAMPNGGHIDIHAVCVDADADNMPEAGSGDGWVILAIEDNGTGIDDEVVTRIFDPFFTTKDPGKGTGLGLSTVFGIVEQSGGIIDVSSEVGRGTRFTITLPRVTVAPPDRLDFEVGDSGKDGGCRILVLEDDPLVRELIVFALNRDGFEISEAKNGDTAVEVLENADLPFDILCTDAVFPGAPLSRVIETYEDRSPQGRVLVCSGYVPEDLAIDGIESGRYDYLAKPFSAEQLLEKVSRVRGCV